MKVADVMVRNPFFESPQVRLYQALQVMDTKHIRHLLICDESGRLVGILSDRDLKRHMSATYATESEKAEDRLTMLKTAEEVMTTDPFTCPPDTPLKELVHVMADSKYGAVPVVDADNKPIGIVTSIDLLRVLHSLL